MKPTDRQLSGLVRYFQSWYKLDWDGIFGPKTAAELDKYLDKAYPEGAMEKAWGSAMNDVGCGGSPGTNNYSPWIVGMRANLGFPTNLRGPWCAIWASMKLKEAGIPVKSRGAYTLCEKMANYANGVEVTPDGMLQGRTYLACWKRGRWDTHGEAHVRFVRKLSTGMVEWIEGNGKGDKVNTGLMSPGAFSDKLIMIAGWKD